MEDVVIAGIAGKLPESENLQEFWENLINGVDMVTEDDRRWKPGKLSDSELFQSLKKMEETARIIQSVCEKIVTSAVLVKVLCYLVFYYGYFYTYSWSSVMETISVQSFCIRGCSHQNESSQILAYL